MRFASGPDPPRSRRCGEQVVQATTPSLCRTQGRDTSKSRSRFATRTGENFPAPPSGLRLDEPFDLRGSSEVLSRALERGIAPAM
jgi:hypothetical protein